MLTKVLPGIETESEDLSIKREYPEDSASYEFIFEWPKYSPPPSIVKFGSLPHQPFIAVPAKNPFELYAPLKRKGLLGEFAKLGGVGSTRDIEFFVRNYGLTGIGRLRARKRSDGSFVQETPDVFAAQLKEGAPLGELWFLEPVDLILEEAEKVHKLVVMTDTITRGEGSFWDIQQGGEEQIISFVDTITDAKPGTHEDNLFVAKKHLATEINLNLFKERITPYLNARREGGFVPGFKVHTLLGAVYLQLYRAVTKHESFERCNRCGSLFIPNHKNQRTCPPPPGYSKSLCKSHGESKDAYWKKRSVQLFRKGISESEIANKSGYSIEKISEWIKKGV